MAGGAGTFLEVTAETRPALLGTFAPLRNRRGRRGEEDVAARVYRALPPSTSFPEAVLAAATHRLGVVRVKGESDGGHPARVLSSLRRAGLRPTWLDRVELREAG